MCCHQHPDNGHGLALEKVDSTSMSPWTLEELRTRHEDWWNDSKWSCKTHGNRGTCQEAMCFLDWLEQG